MGKQELMQWIETPLMSSFSIKLIPDTNLKHQCSDQRLMIRMSHKKFLGQ
jgi:hypothetical protein